MVGSIKLKRRPEMKVLRSEAVSLCEALGYKTAATWDRAKMAEKLVSIADTVAVGDVELDEPLQDLLERIIEVGGQVELVKDQETSDGEQVGGQPSNNEQGEGQPGEAEAKGETKSKAKAKAKAKSPAKTASRWQCCLDAVLKMTGPATREELVRRSDQLYVQFGGRSNLKESALYTRMAVEAALTYGVLRDEGDLVAPVGTEVDC